MIARAFVALLLGLCVSLAHAQPSCWPAPVGAGTSMIAGDHADGRFWHWHCPHRFGWRSHVIVERTGHRWQMPEIAPGAALVDLLTAAYRANVQHDCAHPPTEIAALCQAAFSAADGAAPAPLHYSVAPNPRATDDPATRPMYARTEDDQVGLLIPGRRAPVGEACMCLGVGIERAGVAYCPLASDATRQALAVCTTE